MVCTAVGEVDVATGPLLLDRLQKATSDEPRHLVVDLSGVTFFSAAGVDVLMQALTAQQGRYAMVLVGNSRPVMRVLDVLKLTQRFPRYDGVDEAVAAAAEPSQRDRCVPLRHGRAPAAASGVDDRGETVVSAHDQSTA